MNTGLIIASTASITDMLKSKQEYIAGVLDLQVVFDEKSYPSGDIDLDTLFEKIEEEGKIPNTSQPSPADVNVAISSGLEKFENLVIITPHSELSGTYQNVMNNVRESKDAEKIKVFEVNGGIAVTEAVLIDECIKLIDQGLEFNEITKSLEEVNSKMRAYAFPSDFKYLKASGRVKGAAAQILDALNVRIVVEMEGASPIIAHKGRGAKSILKYINNNFISDEIEKVYYTPIKDDKDMQKAVIDIFAKKGVELIMTEEANSVPAVHLGPNNFALAILSK